MRKSITITLFLVCATASAQIIEVPASFDSEGTIMEWDRKMEVRASFFPEIDNFERAVLWKSDTLYSLEISFGPLRIRRTLSSRGIDSLRAVVDNFLAGQGKEFGLNQEGRGEFLLWQIPLSLGWYSTAVVSIAQPKNASVATGLFLTSAAATYYVPFMLTKKSPISQNQAHMSIAYGYTGICAGGAMSALFGVNEFRGYCGIMLPTSIAGQVTGYYWGKGFTKPQGQMITQYTNFGMIDLPLVAGMILEEPGKKVVGAAALAGIGGGAYLGHRLFNEKIISEGEPAISSTSGWMGMAAGAGLYITAAGEDQYNEPEINSRIMYAAMFAGNVGGLYLGNKITKGYKFSKGDGLIVEGTTIGGALLGAGLGFLASPKDGDEYDRARIVCGAATLGMAGGYFIGVKNVRNKEHRSFDRLNINFYNVPMGLVMMAAKKPNVKIPIISIEL